MGDSLVSPTVNLGKVVISDSVVADAVAKEHSVRKRDTSSYLNAAYEVTEKKNNHLKYYKIPTML